MGSRDGQVVPTIEQVQSPDKPSDLTAHLNIAEKFFSIFSGYWQPGNWNIYRAIAAAGQLDNSKILGNPIVHHHPCAQCDFPHQCRDPNMQIQLQRYVAPLAPAER